MWIETMTEACGSYSSYACHVLFIFLLLECSPAEPRIMYDQFLDHMKSDLYIQRLRHDGYNEQEAIRYSTNDLLCHIQLGLNECAKSNSDFMIPEVDFVLFAHLDLGSGERDPNAQQYYERSIVTITNEQRVVFDTLQECLDQGTGVVPGAGGNSFFFLDASAGTGKTYLINLLLAYV